MIMIQLLNDSTFAIVGTIGLATAAVLLLKVYAKVISKLH